MTNRISKSLQMVLLFIICMTSFKVVSAPRIIINSENKENPEGYVKTYVAGVCGQDYELVTPYKADIWDINITIVSELQNQSVHIWIYEAIGEYPYNYSEQTDAPYANGLGNASLFTILDTSKKYEVWVRDAYAKQFTGSIEESWRPYILNGGFEEPIVYDPYSIPGWNDGGMLGVSEFKTSFSGKSLFLCQWEHGSDVWQDILFNDEDLSLVFWYRPIPQDYEVGFQVKINEHIIFEGYFNGSNSQYSWEQVIISIKQILESYDLELGTHELRFYVPSGTEYNVSWSSHVGVDNVTLASYQISNFDTYFSLQNTTLIYPSQESEKALNCSGAMVSDWLASAFISTKTINCVEGLDTESNYVNQTSGRPFGEPGNGIISFGGPIVNPVVKYAELDTTLDTDRAPLKFVNEGSNGTFKMWDGTTIPGATLSWSHVNDDEDLFMIELYGDKDSRNIMICYGLGWKGTYAAGKYFHTEIYPNLSSYPYSWIIVKWEDTNGNRFVNTEAGGDTYTLIATG